MTSSHTSRSAGSFLPRFHLLLVLVLLFVNISIFVVRGEDEAVVELIEESVLADSEDETPISSTLFDDDDDDDNEEQDSLYDEIDLTSPPPAQEQEAIQVNDYLETLDAAELRTICVDRGFDIAPRSDGLPLGREDYLEAARRCLSLEDEMNAILASNPDLAAELEAEILRMQQHKERLEAERETLLQEKALLEQQLEQAGIDLEAATSTNHKSSPKTLTTHKHPSEMTATEVLVETFTQLYERVRQDVEFVGRVARPVLQPVLDGAKMAWRYSRPHVEALAQQVWHRTRPLRETVRDKIQQFQQERLEANQPPSPLPKPEEATK